MRNPFIVLALLFFTPFPQAQQVPLPTTHPNEKDDVHIFFWANDFYDTCRDSVVKAGDNLKDTARVFFNRGQCSGYILAYAEALSESQGVCAPPHVTRADVEDGIQKILSDSPNLRDKQLPAAFAVGMALQKLFPCSKH
jgi:Rap1a immunity proteins